MSRYAWQKRIILLVWNLYNFVTFVPSKYVRRHYISLCWVIMTSTPRTHWTYKESLLQAEPCEDDWRKEGEQHLFYTNGKGNLCCCFHSHIALIPVLKVPLPLQEKWIQFLFMSSQSGKKISMCQREANSQTILQCTADRRVKLHDFSIVSIYLELIIWIS